MARLRLRSGELDQLVLLGAIAALAALLVSPVARGERALAAGDEPSEIVELRTASSKTYRNSDGTFTTALFPGVIHYRADDGTWLPIDAQLVESPLSDYERQGRALPFEADLKDRLEAEHLRLSIGGETFTLTLEGAKAGPAAFAGRKVSYAGAFPGVDLEYELLGDRVKETLVLAGPDAPDRYRFTLASTGGKRLIAQPRRDGSYAVGLRGTSDPLFVLAAPTAGEADAPAEPGRAVMTVAAASGNLAIDLAVDPAWLRSPERRFPVLLDPTIVIPSPVADASFDVSCPTCTGKTEEPDRLWIGSDATTSWRSGLRFDLGGIPAGAELTGAQLKLYYSGHALSSGAGTTVANELRVHRMTRAWSELSTTGDLRFQAEQLASYALPADPSTQWISWDVTGAVESWFYGAEPNHGFLVKREPEAVGAGGVAVPSRLYVEPTVRPRLEATWREGIDLKEPQTLHSNGSDLAWTRTVVPESAPFERYEVHRSPEEGFTPSERTRLARITDPATTSYRDTTAAPGGSFSYKVTVNGTAASAERRVTLPADGRARKLLQPGAAGVKATYLSYGWGPCENHGAEDVLRVGRDGDAFFRPLLHFDLADIGSDSNIDEATLSLWHPWSLAVPATISAHPLTAAWDEGTGWYECTGDGATWDERSGGVAWAQPGGDYEPTPAATVDHDGEESPGWDEFDLRATAQRWVGGQIPNHGVLLRADYDAYADIVADDAPLAYWRLGEAAGSTTAADATGNGNTLTEQGTGAVEFGGAGALARDSDTSAQLPGLEGDTLTGGDRFAFAGNAAFSVETWINPLSETNLTGYPNIAEKEGSDNNGQRTGWVLWLHRDASGPLYVGFDRWAAGAKDTASTWLSSGEIGTWMHVVATYDGSTMRIYKDGQLIDEQESSRAMATHDEPFDLGDMLHAQLDETAVYDRELSADQVWTHYLAGKHVENAQVYWSDDYTVASTLQPKLALTYTDGSQAIGPMPVLVEPAAGSTLSGQVTLEASATDDRRVDLVQFLVDGNVAASDETAPFGASWDSRSVANGVHAITVKAVDDAGNEATSAATSVTVANSAPPTASVDVAWASYDQVVLADQPSAYWRLGEGSGASSAYDASGNGHSGAYGGNVSAGVPGAPAGTSDTAAQFAGVQGAGAANQVTVTDPDALDVGSGGFSVEAWVKTNQNGEAVLVGKWSAAAPRWRITVTNDSGNVGRVRAVIQDGVNPQRTAYGPAIRVDDGHWHHVLVVFDRDLGISVYVDGFANATSGAMAADSSNDADLQIGGEATGDAPLVGDLDEVAFYRSALEAERVRAHYRAGRGATAYRDAVVASAPGAYWRLGEGPRTGWAQDSSGNGLHGYYELDAHPGAPGALADDPDTAVEMTAPDDGLTNDEVEVLDAPGLDFGTSDFSAEAWIKTTVNEERVFLSKCCDAGPVKWELSVTNDSGLEGRVRSVIRDGTVSRTAYGPPIPVDDGEWHHVLVAYDRDWGTRIHVDGIEEATQGPVLGDISNDVDLEIGDSDTADGFRGTIDEVALYPRTLSAAEAQEHNDEGRTGTRYAQLVLADEPRAYWRLGEPETWRLARDASGNGADGLYEAVRTGMDGVAAAGDGDLAARFGERSFVHVGDRFDFAGRTPFSLEAWIHPEHPAGFKVDDYWRIFAKADSSSPRQGWTLWVHGSSESEDKLHLALERFRDDASDYVDADASVLLGAWTHIVGTYDGSTLRLYVNGVEADSEAAALEVVDTASPLLIGANGFEDYGDSFVGKLDELAVHERALSATEVADRYRLATAEGGPVWGAVSLRGEASDDEGVEKVEFYADGGLLATDTSAPYEATWNTLDADRPAYDGEHLLTTRAYDSGGQVTTSQPLRVTAANTTGTSYQAEITSTPLPDSMTYDPDLAPQEGHDVDVTVKNLSALSWSAADVELGWRWVESDSGAVVAEGDRVSLSGDVSPEESATRTLTVRPPAPPLGMARIDYRLRFDLYSTAAATWFAAAGNRPLEQPVTINQAVAVGLGLERYYHYEGEDVGAGMQHLVNLGSGNSLLRWTPFQAPGRGLATVVDLTYNSLDGAASPAGRGWSLAVSSLARIGSRLDIQPTYVELVDGDGTTHRFAQRVAGDGTVYYAEPPGVHLYVRRYSLTDAERAWAVTRPDRVTFFFDSLGYPTFVEDGNGNRLEFVLEDVPVVEVLDGETKRVSAVKDAAGRSFDLAYVAAAEAQYPAQRGRLKRLTDHTGSALDFEYSSVGELIRIVQRGNGNTPPDRSFGFAYSEGGQLNQVVDPRGNSTAFGYPEAGRLGSRTNRGGEVVSYAYDTASRTTTVTAPLQRTSTYRFDAEGKVVRVTNPLGQVVKVAWSPDRHVSKVVEPTGRYVQFAYDSNGYLTDEWDQLRNHTKLEYEHVPVDANDVEGKWRDGQEHAHISQLVAKTDPKGTATASPADDYRWTFAHDEKGNVVRATDPLGYSERYAYNDDGTLASSVDANGQETRYPAYDAGGQPTLIVSPTGATTRLGYDGDGLLLWLQDPNHAAYEGGEPREYRSYFSYDAFHRLVEQSAPKSTEHERGTLICTAVDYDPNDNLLAEYRPAYGGLGGCVRGAATTSAYDGMDRLLSSEDPPHQSGDFLLGSVSQASTGQTVTVDTQTADWAKLAVGNNVDVLTRSSGQPVAEGREITAVDRPAGQVTLDTAVTVTTAEGLYEVGEVRTDLSSPRRQTFAYDAAGRLERVVLPGVAGSSTPDDFVVELRYDLLDRIVTQVAGAGTLEARLTHSCYDLPGDLRWLTAPKAALPEAPTDCASGTPPSFTQRFGYDAAHRLLSSTDALGHSRTLSYDANGDLVSETDELGAPTAYEFSQRGELTKVIEPIERNSSGLVTDEAVTKLEYDPVGNLVREISPRAWDESVSQKRSFKDYVSSLEYDADGRLLRVKLPTDAATEQAWQHYAYDANGDLAWVSRPVATLDPGALTSEQKTVIARFDPGWVRDLNEPVRGLVRFDYIAEGLQASRKPQNGVDGGNPTFGPEETWAYYPDGLLKEEKDPAGHLVSYAYDLRGGLRRALDASGVFDPDQSPLAVHASYNRFGEPLRVEQRSAAGLNATVYTYDANGNIDSRTDEGLLSTFGYDEADRLVSTCTPDHWIDYLYIDTSLLAEETLRRRPTTSTPCAEHAAWTQLQRSAYGYLPNGLLASQETYAGDPGQLVESHTLTYEDTDGDFHNGHVLTDAFRLVGPDGTLPCTAQACTASYVYDARERLIEATNGAPADSAAYWRMRYTLTLDGDVDSEELTTWDSGTGQPKTETTDYLYGAGGQLKSVTLPDGAIEYHRYKQWFGTVDCITTEGPNAACDEGGQPRPLVKEWFKFDALERLEAFTSQRPGSEVETTYTHDAFDRVVVEEETRAGTRRTEFSYVGLTDAVSQEEITGGAHSLKRYRYDAYLSRTGAAFKTPAEVISDYTYARNVHGDVSLLIDAAGQAEASYGYKPYGDLDGLTRESTDPKNDPLNPYRFNDRRYDSGSGSIDMGFRRFSPDVGRFLEQDFYRGALADLTLTLDPLTQGRYSFAAGNPISFVETDGHYFAEGTTTSTRDKQGRRRTLTRPAAKRARATAAASHRRDVLRSQPSLEPAQRATPRLSDEEQARLVREADAAYFESQLRLRGITPHRSGGALASALDTAAGWTIPNLRRAARGEPFNPYWAAFETVTFVPALGTLKGVGPVAKAVAPAKRTTGTTVLGHDPGYVQLSEKLGARRFDVPQDVWARMSDAERWAANQRFLDRTIARGDDIILATPVDRVRPGSFFERELRYLFSQGYRPDATGTRLLARRG